MRRRIESNFWKSLRRTDLIEDRPDVVLRNLQRQAEQQITFLGAASL